MCSFQTNAIGVCFTLQTNAEISSDVLRADKPNKPADG